MTGETERILFCSGNSIAITIPKKWLKKKGLKKGDYVKMVLNDKILIDVPKTEEELHKEIEEYEKSLKGADND
jgi:antitoxin component of MazEF toxin-antitoxin module